MQIQSTSPASMFADSTAPTGSATGSGSTSAGSTDSTTNPNGTPTEASFLQLLVAQLQYQDPTSPQDPTQFVSELAQFSELQGVLGIQQDTDTIVKDISSAGATTAPATAPTNTQATTPSMTQSPTAATAL